MSAAKPAVSDFAPSNEGKKSAMHPPPVVFTIAETEAASDAWGFNCGPGALCGALGLKPDQVRPHMGDFEAKGYTNPTLMWKALKSLGVKYSIVGDDARGPEQAIAWPKFGLARIQWGGPWTRAGVPIAARYRQSHWVASWRHAEGLQFVFDVNTNGWRTLASWSTQLVPWLLEECVKRNDGTWWLTRSVEILEVPGALNGGAQ